METKVTPEQKHNIRGYEIQKHLEKVYEDFIMDGFGRKVKQLSLDKIPKIAIPCMSCESKETYIVWSENYSGYRGMCDACKHNWPES